VVGGKGPYRGRRVLNNHAPAPVDPDAPVWGLHRFLHIRGHAAFFSTGTSTGIELFVAANLEGRPGVPLSPARHLHAARHRGRRRDCQPRAREKQTRHVLATLVRGELLAPLVPRQVKDLV
jgi:hypothetical protein